MRPVGDEFEGPARCADERNGVPVFGSGDASASWICDSKVMMKMP